MSDSKIIWVTGAKGFVGAELCQRFADHGYQVVGTDTELSVGETERMEAFASEVQPLAVVNCAGIRRDATGLSNRINAYEVNALGARNVALAANSCGAIMVQVSSDDVYSSKLEEPVNEFDNPHPDTPYGKSKRAGEAMVRDTMHEHIIVRSSWLYHASGGRMKEVLDAAAQGRKVEARLDQFAAPTSIATYADFLVKAIEHRAFGTFHITSKGRASRYDFAAKVLEYAGYEPGSVLVPTTDRKTSENVVLESLMLEMFGVDLPTWEEDLHSYMSSQGIAKA
ncbi:MAG: sugar nucleotide-binding protein [Coriobacteriaceae bacterium]|nr:sugar nucleotide-binding protein [Coriobacteriaceae bacterium]MDD6768652.1 sugar nucleotide-binding protein [Coriobacteriaceae bacterium]